MSLLQVSDISLQEEEHIVLKGINFHQQALQKIAIAGETGSGKSTLLQTIAGLVQPSAGQVLFEGKKVIGPQEKLIPGHAGIVYLSQQFELPPSLRVEQVLRYANTLSAAEADMLYQVCRISHLLLRKTNQLSGGERQRIALARLLSSRPRLLLLDEPFSNLDIGHKNILKSVIRDIGEKLRITLILISHDPLDTLSWADEILILKEGQILQRGSPKQIYHQPVDAYAAALFGSYNLLSPAQAQAFSKLSGTEPNGKSMLIRPENFKIVPEENQAIGGKVNKVSFFGSYYEVEIALPETIITVKTTTNLTAKNEKIYVSLSPDKVWYV